MSADPWKVPPGLGDGEPSDELMGMIDDVLPYSATDPARTCGCPECMCSRRFRAMLAWSVLHSRNVLPGEIDEDPPPDDSADAPSN